MIRPRDSSVGVGLPDFRTLFEAVPGAYLVLLPDAPRYTIVAASDAYLLATFTSRDVILRRGLFEVLPRPHSHDASSGKALRASLERVVSTRRPDSMAVQRYRLRQPDGLWDVRYWSPVNAPVLEASGSSGVVTHIIHRVVDVTDVVRTSRKRRRSVSVQAPRRSWPALEVQAELVARARELEEANARLHEARERLEERVAERDRVLGMEREARAAIEAADEARTTFFSNVSHEFRTPLTLILGPVEDALRAGGQDGSALTGEGLETVRRSALRMLRLVDSLLALSRAEAGRVEARYEATDLAAFTADLVSAFTPAFERAELALLVDCPPLPRPVHVDRTLWETIVYNLLANALKHTFAGSVQVALEAADDAAELRIRDTGVGIPADQLDRLFERFHRVPGVRARTGGGAGIGLTLVKELVRLHGGTVSVQSREGQGTTFTVRVPFGSAHLPSEGVTASPAARSQPDTPGDPGVRPYLEEAVTWLRPPEEGAVDPRPATTRARMGRILLAEDDADMRRYLAGLLNAEGWRVECVADGAGALDAARSAPPDLVLTDVMMPGMDGLELLRRLREDPVTCLMPVVLLTARAGEEERVSGLDSGADDYLVKPFSARELVARVSASLELARMRREATESRHQLQRAEEAITAKVEFLSRVSHELRTPLNAIAGYVDLLLLEIHGGLNDAQRHALERVRVSQGLLLTLVGDILSYSRLEAGRIEYRIEDVHLSSTLAEVADVIRPQAEARSIDLDVSCPRHLKVRADRERLRQILLNLLSNAVKFTSRDGSVRVRCTRGSSASRNVSISVVDEGCGIAPEDVERIFEPFVRGGHPSEPSGEPEGLGLGLAISRDLAHQMDGDIRVRSTPGRGSTFTLTLPRPTASEARGEEQRPLRRRRTSRGAGSRPS